MLNHCLNLKQPERESSFLNDNQIEINRSQLMHHLRGGGWGKGGLTHLIYCQRSEIHPPGWTEIVLRVIFTNELKYELLAKPWEKNCKAFLWSKTWDKTRFNGNNLGLTKISRRELATEVDLGWSHFWSCKHSRPICSSRLKPKHDHLNCVAGPVPQETSDGARY